ncbi:class A sortase [Lactobacillus delbrueckii]|uniref:Class A sortase n=1 Tax=Lactobacillus delbrueckii TaxID=1584 RepID=A0AAW5YZM3_9LACO|nr:class A sortase [Lactobacillus delbrueckii]MDA3768542.1 class A sortase [Lactobacillus delbrueckii]
MKNKKKEGRQVHSLSNLAALLLLFFGGAALWGSEAGDLKIRENSQETVSHLTAKKIKENEKNKASFDFKKVKELTNADKLEKENKSTSGAIGIISVPSVKMTLPVMKGLSNYAMTTGGGTMREDMQMGKGNYALAGHYMTNKGELFEPVERIKKGNMVYLTDLKKVYSYKVYWKKVVAPTAVYLTEDTKKPIVTLITCADGGKNRWAVRGKLVKTEKAENGNLDFFKSEN